MPPSKLTPRLHKKIVRLVESGNYATTAAAACSISPRTLTQWLTIGERLQNSIDAGELEDPVSHKKNRGGDQTGVGGSAESSPLNISPSCLNKKIRSKRDLSVHERACLSLYTDVTRARASAETYAVECLRDGFGDPRMAVEYLSRTNRKGWGKSATLDVHDTRQRERAAKRVEDDYDSMTDDELLAIIADDRLRGDEQTAESAAEKQHVGVKG